MKNLLKNFGTIFKDIYLVIFNSFSFNNSKFFKIICKNNKNHSFEINSFIIFSLCSFIVSFT